MKINKFYLKIFLAFVAVLITAEAVVFGVIFSGNIHPPFFFDSIERATVVNRLVEREMNGITVTRGTLREKLNPLLKLLVKGSSGQIWLTDDLGEMVGASFDGPPPDIAEDLVPVNLKAPDGIRFFEVHAKNYKSVYLESDVRLKDDILLNVHFLQGKHPRRAEWWFFKGLLFLTALGALFLFPVSRRITKPILQLTETVERLGQGDFSQRVPEKGHDEIAILARKFNRMAGRLEKMVMTGKELTAHLSHELRSPLARMRISVQMLMEQNEADEGASGGKFLVRIEKEIENMDVLIGKILDLSKMDMLPPPPKKEILDIADLLRSLLDKYTPMIQQRDILLTTDIVTVPKIPGHEYALSVLLDNVLSNAIKYVDNNGCIRVNLAAKEDIVITVFNTHLPLAEEDLSAMFTPFHRLDSGKVRGSGLGLASARKIATLHQGTIKALNEEDGICIIITLPLRSN